MNMLHELVLNMDDNIQWIVNPESAPPKNTKKTLRFVDLFSGCGGLSYGVTKAAHKNGFLATCALAVDLKSAPLEVYEENIPHEDGAIVNEDILQILSDSSMENLCEKEVLLAKKVGIVDILVAGPPCQGHSNLNNSTRRNDPRNTLYLACIRAVEIFHPKLIVIENVPSVVHSQEEVVQATEEKLCEIGYRVKHLNVNFLDLGVPQSRKRHVLVASKNDFFCDTLATSSACHQNPTLRDFIYDINKEEGLMCMSSNLSQDNQSRIDLIFKNDLFDLPNEHRPPCHRDKQHSYKSVYGRLHWDKPAQTLTSGYGSMGQGRYIHPSEKRTINSREAARIQGFPDCYSFSKVSKLTDLREMIANAVPPQLTYKITDIFLNYNSQIGKNQ